MSSAAFVRPTRRMEGPRIYIPPDTPQRIEEYFQRVVDTAAAIREPFEQAFFAMVHLPYL